MPPNRPRKGMTVPGSAQHSGSLHSMRKAPFLTDEGLLQRITTLGDPLFNDSVIFLMTIFQFVGTDQIIVPSIGAGFIGGQLGQGNGFLPPSGLGVRCPAGFAAPFALPARSSLCSALSTCSSSWSSRATVFLSASWAPSFFLRWQYTSSVPV